LNFNQYNVNGIELDLDEKENKIESLDVSKIICMIPIRPLSWKEWY